MSRLDALVARAGDVGLVAEREVRQRIRGRVFRVGTLLILLGVAAAIVIPVATKTAATAEQVGTVGAAPSSLDATVRAAAAGAGSAVVVVPQPDLAAGEAGLAAGRLDVVIVDGRQLVVDRAVGTADTSATATLVRSLSRVLGVEQALDAAGLSEPEASQALRAPPVPVRALRPAAAPKAKAKSLGPSIVGLVLIFVMLTQYLTWTLIGVMEEKSSRVVEVLLAAVGSGKLLAGKVLGIGLVAFAQAAVILAVALSVAAAVGSDLLKGSGPLEVVSTLVWLVLGYAFYSWIYAAAGSMAERQDQVQSLAFPLSLPMIFGYVVALSSAGSSAPSGLVKVLAYLPPTAPFSMPVLVGMGPAAWWQFALSVLVSLAATVAAARLATRVYRRAILRTGRRVPLREALSAR
ncbi:ABC transporter permease [Acidiferrimicrobium sp. IK]|uniref:ABC transporter permease n=1 Tax=Acidiferrimicrobium sp. IK TaxID=2871700 RepID=UPI0021CB0AFA|nr:ABC transporter permease [Acidiferrimicrobium sp. IK]MCU4183364.1 ABC transporter permease [Acidiferrimicrobium sp. IK]